MDGNSKRTVYVIRSVANPPHYYVGVTSEVEARLAAHNEGRLPNTAR